MPRPYPAGRETRPVHPDELREFNANRTAKHVASILGRWPQTVRSIAKRHGLPLARERARRAG